MTDFAERRKPPAPRKEEPLDLLRNRGGIEGPLSTIAEFVEFVRKTSEEWQTADIKDLESDEDSFFNDARIVGQVWFRGQGSCRLNLMPGLYREETWRHLRKAKPGDEEQFEALYWIEHELRIDFESYGQLLNESSQAKTAIDWYFLMQHYRVPTRLLDWTTNALAALFFAIDRHSPYSPYFRAPSVNDSENPSGQLQVAVWMVDAYWLAGHLSEEEWNPPILAYTEDAARYVPRLDQLIERGDDTEALIPKHSMPIEQPAMHPGVAAQEGRFIIFGRTPDLLKEKIRLDLDDDCEVKELRFKQGQFKVDDVDAKLRELANLGISRRTLFPDFAGLAEFVHWKHFHGIPRPTQ